MRCLKLFMVLLFLSVPVWSQTHQLTLDACKELAGKNNPDLVIAKIEQHAADSDVKQFHADRLPQLNFKGSYRYQSEVPELSIPPVDIGFGNPITVFDAPMTLGSNDTYDFTMTVTQPLFTGFQLKNRDKAMQYAADSKKVDYDRLYSELMYKVETAYRNVQKAEMFIEISQTAKEQVESHLLDMRNFYEQGMVRKDQVMQVEVKLAETELSIVQAEHALANATAYLENVIGEELNGDIETEKVNVEKLPPLSLESSLNAAYHNRLEFQSLAAMKNAAKSSVDAAKGGYMPTLAAFASLGYGKPGLDFVNNEWMDYWVAGASLEWSLWNWGKTSSKIQSARLQVNKIQESEEKLRQAIKLDVTQSGLRVKEAVKRMQLTKQIVDQSEETFRIVENNFKQGMANNSEFLDVQMDLTRARLQSAQAQVDYLIALANLKRAEGTIKEVK